jgi:Tfp pilus assembly protein PilX
MNRSDLPTVRPRRSGENGSAYILVLLVLVILTMVGIALTFVTQTEVQLGANERSINRTFYAAHSGVHVAVARVLVDRNYAPATFTLNSTEQDNAVATPTSDASFQDVVQIQPVVAVHDTPCNYCQVNVGKTFSYVTHAVSVTATRTGTGGATEVQLASQRVMSMVGIQPVELSLASQDVKRSELTLLEDK